MNIGTILFYTTIAMGFIILVLLFTTYLKMNTGIILFYTTIAMGLIIPALLCMAYLEKKRNTEECAFTVPQSGRSFTIYQKDNSITIPIIGKLDTIYCNGKAYKFSDDKENVKGK